MLDGTHVPWSLITLDELFLPCVLKKLCTDGIDCLCSILAHECLTPRDLKPVEASYKPAASSYGGAYVGGEVLGS
ncbi:hypothetical protein PGTUg99_035543 [Puccinia graminis f. sp. tritici]|uniref:Uncharacterized protein n=1 Tax=Puccinia graminis f. sp. tritici TaxID=56615 RepID=A0A5B0SME3_PUCGR|nr:hypothetical protein PGTUg99_035543 [Puccinia graminis f. sp. tritici]